MGELNEQVIWTVYEPAISIAGKCKFENFTELNVQAFYRLKLQSIENKIGASHQCNVINIGEEKKAADMPAVE